MGVDYTATFGIGIKVELSFISDYHQKLRDITDEEHEDYSYDDIFEDIELGDNGIKYGYSGNSFSNKHEYYLFIKNPFENGYEGLKDKIENFETFIKKIGIEDYKIDVVGGGLVW